MVSCGAVTVVFRSKQSVRLAVREAIGWRENPDSPVKPTPSGVDPYLGVWVSLL